MSRTLLIVLPLLVLIAACAGGPGGPVPDMEQTAPEPPERYVSPGKPAPEGKEIRKYAEDEPGKPQGNFGIQPVHDNEIFATLSVDRLEYRLTDGKDALLWDAAAWIGEDYNKLYLESEGEKIVEGGGDIESAEIELFYGRTIASFWDLRLGVRHDFRPEPERSFGAFGIQGLAPYWFEVEANAYVSEDADVSSVIEVEYELLLTQRLILVPRLEADIHFQDEPEYGIGAGISGLELGARLRYEIVRRFAPYIGASWERSLGETGLIAEQEGEDPETLALVFGVRLWF